MVRKIRAPDLQAAAGQSNCTQTLTAFVGISLPVIHVTFQDQVKHQLGKAAEIGSRFKNKHSSMASSVSSLR